MLEGRPIILERAALRVRTLPYRLIGALSLCGLSLSCSSLDESSGRAGAWDAGAEDASLDRVDLSIDGSAGSEGSEVALNPLCGVVEADCVPDDPDSCFGVSPPDGGLGGMGGASSGGASSGGASSGGSSPGGAGGEGGFGEAGAGGEGFGGAGDAGGAGGEFAAPAVPGDSEPAEPGEQELACRVERKAGTRVRVCAVAGQGELDDPCVSSSDCQPGLGCVAEGLGGRCRPYCCAGASECPTGTYCAERQLRETVSTDTTILLPVCMPAENCSLAEQYPCPEGMQCQCSEGKACMVVRADGTTACVAPGAGESGDSCPCAWGHVCSQASGTCKKLCLTTSNSPNEACGDGACQVSSSLPENWGICVGETLPDGG